MLDRPSTVLSEELLDRLIKQAEAAPEESPTEPPSVPSPQAPGDTNVGEGGVPSALLSLLPQLIQGMGVKSETASAADHAAEAAPLGRGPSDRHTALLCAIKPYLSSSRREGVEQLLRLCRLWDTLQAMGLQLPTLLSALSGISEREG